MTTGAARFPTPGGDRADCSMTGTIVTTTSITPDMHRDRPAAASSFHLRRQLMGFAYTIPTVVFVVVLFVTPLLLAARMSLSNWGLLTGEAGINFPKNFVSITKNQLFWPSVIFTLEYTVLVTILLLGLGLGLALLVQVQSRWANMLRTVFLLPVSLGLAAASLLAYGFFSPDDRTDRADARGDGRGARRRSSSSARRSTRCCRRPSSSSGSMPASTC